MLLIRCVLRSSKFSAHSLSLIYYTFFLDVRLFLWLFLLIRSFLRCIFCFVLLCFLFISFPSPTSTTLSHSFSPDCQVPFRRLLHQTGMKCNKTSNQLTAYFKCRHFTLAKYKRRMRLRSQPPSIQPIGRTGCMWPNEKRLFKLTLCQSLTFFLREESVKYHSTD